MGREDDFFKELLSTFKIEAEEHLSAMTSGLLQLERTPSAERQAAVVEAIFRDAHSLKGAARAVNLTDIETICQSLESVFAALKRQEMSLSPSLLDRLYRAVDTMVELLDSPGDAGVGQDRISTLVHQLENLTAGGSERGIEPETNSKPGHTSSTPASSTARKPALPISTPESNFHGSASGVEDLSCDPESQQVQQASHANAGSNLGVTDSSNGSRRKPGGPHSDAVVGEPASTVGSPGDRGVPLSGQKSPLSETVRISTAKLDSVLLQAEEMLSVKLMSSQRETELRDVMAMLARWEKEWTKAIPEIHLVRRRMAKKTSGDGRRWSDPRLERLLEFLDWNHAQFKTLEDKLKTLAKSAESDNRSVSGMVNSLLEDTKKLLLLPFSTLLRIFPKLVRDLSRDLGKDVDLEVEGGEVEIDKRILEELKDPLIHLIRNCIDHGIEPPAEREQHGKPPRGTVRIAIAQTGSSKVNILISDDGRGIDPINVKQVAIKRGIISEQQADGLSDEEAISLIFQPGMSSKPNVTNISGRGLGLSIVRERVERLGGQLSVHTQGQKGTTFRLVLPLTLATLRAILVRAGGQVFAIPTANISHAVRVKPGDIGTVENQETLCFDGRAISLVRLEEVLELPRKKSDRKGTACIPVLVLESGETPIAFSVDELLSEQEILVKPLGRQLSRVRNIAGATLLGSGQVVPILNVSDLMKSAARASVPSTRRAVAREPAEAKRKAVLVVEDSITSRTLLRNKLESAGYLVKTTVDGLDAFTALRTEDFDLVVSDVEMPRMDGFDLTARIRHDKELADLPVVLVTSLDSREDRERGIDVGANAYIVKSRFDQDNLLDVIEKLI